MMKQDSANTPATMDRLGQQDSASAPTPHHHAKEAGQRKRPHHSQPSPCPYAMGMWHLIVSGREG